MTDYSAQYWMVHCLWAPACKQTETGQRVGWSAAGLISSPKRMATWWSAWSPGWSGNMLVRSQQDFGFYWGKTMMRLTASFSLGWFCHHIFTSGCCGRLASPSESADILWLLRAVLFLKANEWKKPSSIKQSICKNVSTKMQKKHPFRILDEKKTKTTNDHYHWHKFFSVSELNMTRVILG